MRERQTDRNRVKIHFDFISPHQNMHRAPPVVCLAVGDTQRSLPRERALVIWVLYQKGGGGEINVCLMEKTALMGKEVLFSNF